MKPTLGVFCYGGVDPYTVSWLFQSMNVQTDALGQWYLRFQHGDAAIHRSRARVASFFLDSLKDSDVLVMVDHDVSARPGDLKRLVETCRETRGIVGALVSKRAFGMGYGSRLPDGKHEIGSDNVISMPKGYWVGGAFTAMHRDALNSIVDCHGMERLIVGYYPLFQPMVVVDEETGLGNDITEDWSLCELAWDCGVPVHLDLKPFVTHHGHYHGYTPLDGRPEE